MSSDNLFTYNEIESGKDIAMTGNSQKANNEQKDSNMSIFENATFGKVKVILQNGEPLFCLSDIAKVLEFRDGLNLKNSILREFELSILNMYSFDTGFGVKEFSMITEAQLYFVLMRSNSAKAKPFRQWVTKEVLPTIRKLNIPIADKEKFLPQAQGTAITIQQTFENMQVETNIKNDIAFFRLVDIEKVLGLSAGASRQWIKENWFDADEIDSVRNSHGGTPSNFVAESGLYRILNRTNSPKAKPFERWVTKEVLPSIRKTGGYGVTPQLPQTYKEALRELLNQVEQNEQLQIENAKQQETITDQAEIINAYQVTDKIKRNKQELATLFNRKIRELADLEFGRQYAKCYNEIYKEFASLHCFTHKVDMQFLKTNIDYLSECLKLVLEKIHNAKEQK